MSQKPTTNNKVDNKVTTPTSVIIQKLEAKQGSIGILSLNSEKKLNSLTLEMVNVLSEQLTKWANDDDIALVVLTGSGDKAFCAGADIQVLYQSALEPVEGICIEGEAFFLAEYQLDYQIHCYEKPIICLGNGIVMGGGLGLLAGASHRVVTETTRLAMPEITIGLFPDVGATYFLSRIPYNLGFFFALTGANMNAKDAIFCQLADYLFEWQRYPELIKALQNCAWERDEDNNHQTVNDILNSFSPNNSEEKCLFKPSDVKHNICALEKTCQHSSLSTIVDEIEQFDEDNDFLLKAKNTLASGSPLSSIMIYEQLKRFKYADLQTVFKNELSLVTNMVRFPEFAEGVRALLIDKDNKPDWKFKHFSHVPNSMISHFFTPPWENNPIEAQLN